MSDVDSKIQEILDKESIRDLVHLYCRAADRHDHELMRSFIMRMHMMTTVLFSKARQWNLLTCFRRYKNPWAFCITMSQLIISN